MTGENKMARAKVVRSMETLARSINDESIFDSWLMVGVADGDIKADTTDEEIIEMGYCDDKTFQELMSVFLRMMYRARINGLYADGIVSDTLHIEWR